MNLKSKAILKVVNFRCGAALFLIDLSHISAWKNA